MYSTPKTLKDFCKFFWKTVPQKRWYMHIEEVFKKDGIYHKGSIRNEIYSVMVDFNVAVCIDSTSDNHYKMISYIDLNEITEIFLKELCDKMRKEND